MGIRVWTAGGLAFGLAVGCGQFGRAQGLLPPAAGVNLENVSRGMAEALRDLGRRLSGGPGQIGGGPYLARDCDELRRSAHEWHESSRGINDPYQLRRSYSGIDTSWHRLRAQLAASAAADQGLAQEIRRVDQADATIHQALNLNGFPPNLEGVAVAPSGIDETRRLAYTLAQRGEALASTVQSLYGPNPDLGVVVRDAVEVAQLADQFSDTLNNQNGIRTFEQAQQLFLPVFQKSAALGVTLDRTPMPPDLRSLWLSYATAINMSRDNLNLTNVNPGALPPQTAQAAIPYNAKPAPQVAQWADALDRQVDELIANFGPTAGVVPEGREMLGEMERLRNDVRNFRGDAGQGLDPSRLAYEFRDVDADWQRLARQVNRIARGRSGPNIQRVQQIGETCEQIHRVLGMPGYPPVIRPYRD